MSPLWTQVVISGDTCQIFVFDPGRAPARFGNWLVTIGQLDKLGFVHASEAISLAHKADPEPPLRVRLNLWRQFIMLLLR